MGLFHGFSDAVRPVIITHAAAGALALAVFLIPLITLKGGLAHRRSGWIYVGAMVLVALTAFVVTPWRYFVDAAGTDQSRRFAVFLGFVAALSLASVVAGVRVFRFKARREPSRSRVDLGIPALLFLLSVLVGGLGVSVGDPLLTGFPVLGVAVSARQWRYWRTVPAERMHWWYFHMNEMFTACIATVTAFLVTALPRLAPGVPAQSPLMWFAPTLVMVPVLQLWLRRDRARFEKGRPSG